MFYCSNRDCQLSGSAQGSNQCMLCNKTAIILPRKCRIKTCDNMISDLLANSYFYCERCFAATIKDEFDDDFNTAFSIQKVYHAIDVLIRDIMAISSADSSQSASFINTYYLFIFYAIICYKRQCRQNKDKHFYGTLCTIEEFNTLLDQLVNNQCPEKIKQHGFQCAIWGNTDSTNYHFFSCSAKYANNKWYFFIAEQYKFPEDDEDSVGSWNWRVAESIHKKLPNAFVYYLKCHPPFFRNPNDDEMLSYQTDRSCFFHALEMSFKLSGIDFVTAFETLPSSESLNGQLHDWLRHRLNIFHYPWSPPVSLETHALFDTASKNSRLIPLKMLPPALNHAFTSVQSRESYGHFSHDFKTAPASSKAEHRSYEATVNRRHSEGLKLLKKHYENTRSRTSSGPNIMAEFSCEESLDADSEKFMTNDENHIPPEANTFPANASTSASFPKILVRNHGLNYFALKYLEELKHWLPRNFQPVKASFMPERRLNLGEF